MEYSEYSYHFAMAFFSIKLPDFNCVLSRRLDNQYRNLIHILKFCRLKNTHRFAETKSRF